MCEEAGSLWGPIKFGVILRSLLGIVTLVENRGYEDDDDLFMGLVSNLPKAMLG